MLRCEVCSGVMYVRYPSCTYRNRAVFANCTRCNQSYYSHIPAHIPDIQIKRFVKISTTASFREYNLNGNKDPMLKY